MLHIITNQVVPLNFEGSFNKTPLINNEIINESVIIYRTHKCTHRKIQ